MVEPGATINVNCRNEVRLLGIVASIMSFCKCYFKYQKEVSGLLRASGTGQLEIIQILYQAKCCVTTTDNVSTLHDGCYIM